MVEETSVDVDYVCSAVFPEKETAAGSVVLLSEELVRNCHCGSCCLSNLDNIANSNSKQTCNGHASLALLDVVIRGQ